MNMSVSREQEVEEDFEFDQNLQVIRATPIGGVINVEKTTLITARGLGGDTMEEDEVRLAQLLRNMEPPVVCLSWEEVAKKLVEAGVRVVERQNEA